MYKFSHVIQTTIFHLPTCRYLCQSYVMESVFYQQRAEFPRFITAKRFQLLKWFFVFELPTAAYSFVDHFSPVSDRKWGGFRKPSVTWVGTYRFWVSDVEWWCGGAGRTNIEAARVDLIIQQCNAFTKPVGVNPNLAPIEPLSESVARQMELSCFSATISPSGRFNGRALNYFWFECMN